MMRRVIAGEPSRPSFLLFLPTSFLSVVRVYGAPFQTWARRPGR